MIILDPIWADGWENTLFGVKRTRVIIERSYLHPVTGEWDLLYRLPPVESVLRTIPHAGAWGYLVLGFRFLMLVFISILYFRRSF